jgi:HTH-type transcriptional regulator/antitoxin MqsA
MREFNNQVNVSIVDSPFIMCICKKIHLATSREAAEIFGDGVNAFSRYENGKTKPP